MINCEILIHGTKSIQGYHPQLRAMHSQYEHKESVTCTNSKYINNRYLKTPEKIEKLKTLQTKVPETKKQNVKTVIKGEHR